MKRLALCVIIAAILGCDLPKNLRIAENSTSSIVGISLKVKLYNAMLKEQSTVYFVKLDEKDKDILGTKIIPCNYYRGSMLDGYYAFLVNAEPGTYAAIGSAKYETYTAGKNPTGPSKTDEYGYITFFDEATIKQSITEVGPAQIAFMGSFSINSQLKSVYMNIEKNGDRAQRHYYEKTKAFHEGTYYCGTQEKGDRSKKAEREFLAKAKEYFRNSEWLKIITAALSEFDKTEKGEMI